jgi:integrase
VVVREGAKLHRERVGQNRREAERALRKVGTRVDDGEWRPQLRISFEAWSARWLASIETKPSTRSDYRSTIAYANAAFGGRDVRRIRGEDILALATRMRDGTAAIGGGRPGRAISDSTRAKHLRVLHGCFEAAVQHGYAGRNPVRDVPRQQKPRPRKREAGYFVDDELAPLIAAATPGVYRTLFLTALKTGMRQGELAALSWADIDLSTAVVRVRRSFTKGRMGVPKSHERREVDVTRDLVELLGAWWGELGQPADATLVFPGEGSSGYLDATAVLRRELYPAMRRAGIAREGPTGETRTFHSFRHTYARVALEHGADLTWLQRQLGHSSLAVTVGVYGHWARDARKRHAERLEGAFAV